MLVGIICECGSSETMFRQALKKAGKDFMTPPVYKGKSGLNYWWERLPEKLKNEDNQMLYFYAKDRGKYVIVFWTDGEKSSWSDLAGGIPDHIKAETIIEKLD